MMASRATSEVSGARRRPAHRAMSASPKARPCQGHKPAAAEYSGVRERRPSTASAR